MRFTKEYADYAPVEKHIRKYHAERSLQIAVWLANALVAVWEEIKVELEKSPPPPMLVPIDRRREVRVDSYRAGSNNIVLN